MSNELKFHPHAFVLSVPRLEGFERCTEPGCTADGFPAYGKCWEHTPAEGKFIFRETITLEEFKRRYPRRGR